MEYKLLLILFVIIIGTLGPIQTGVNAQKGIFLSTSKLGKVGFKKKRITEKIITPPRKLTKAACDG